MQKARKGVDPGPTGGNDPPRYGRVVVGFDGSPPSRAALPLSAQEAAWRRAELHVVCAWSMPGGHTSHARVPGPLREACLDDARRALDEAGERLGPSPECTCVFAVAEPPAARALVEASKKADLVVVGSHGRGPLASTVLGSISRYVVHHAHCPVLVVRAPEAPSHGPATASEERQ